MRPHQYGPQHLSAVTDSKMTQVFNDDVKTLMNYNTPYIPHKGIVQKQ